MSFEDFNCIVIDPGSSTLKAGFAGDDAPRVVIPSVIGRPRLKLDGEHFIGDEALSRRGILTLKYPIEHGVVCNWVDVEAILDYTFKTQLRVDPSECFVFLAEPVLNPRANREKITQVMFETYGVNGFFMLNTAALSLLAAGRSTGVAVESGYGATYTSVVYEGFTLNYTIPKIPYAGQDMDWYLQKLLNSKGHQFNTSAEREIVTGMKERICFVSEDYEKDIEISKNSDILKKVYELPDGRNISVNSERFMLGEGLFNPPLFNNDHLGIHDYVNNAVMRADNELRGLAYSNIVLSGGNTMFPGFKERLLKELKKLAPSSIVPEVIGTPERKMASWIGGSVMASSSRMDRLWITAEDYEEDGPAQIREKDYYVGDETQSRRGILSIKYPISCGIIFNWDDMELLLDHTFQKELRSDPKEFFVFMAEPILNPLANREKITQIMFEKFGVPGFFLQTTSALSLFAAGRSTGVAVESGYGATFTSVVYEGHTLNYTIPKTLYAGEDLDWYLQTLLHSRNYDFTTFAEREMVKEMKERVCFVSEDYERDLEISKTSDSLSKTYELPDGRKISVNSERFMVGEGLFNPSLFNNEFPGIHEQINRTLRLADLDLRRFTYSNIVLSGGNTMFPGFKESLLKEMKKLVPSSMVPKVIGVPERKLASWIGGSIMASMSYMEKLWITSQDYEEAGPAQIRVRCF